MLASMADREDTVQENYLRWHGADRDTMSDPRAFLMMTTARKSVNRTIKAVLRRARGMQDEELRSCPEATPTAACSGFELQRRA
jgi:DNA-directed RNA polymerase specialized sigma24 family protein